MKVTELQAFLMSVPMHPPLRVKFLGGERIIFKQDAMLVRVRTDQGLSGYAPGPASPNVSQLINRNLRSAAVNTDPAKIETLRKKVFHRRPQFPEMIQAFGAVEMALTDLRAKAEGCPVSEILGGRVRDRIKLYASAGLYLRPEECAEEAAALSARGFKAYKLKAGMGVDQDLETVSRVRAVIPPNGGIIVDGQAWWCMGELDYTPDQVMEQARSFSKYGLVFLEDPFPPDRRDACSRLTSLRVVPVGAGKHEPTMTAVVSMASDHVVDILEVDGIYQGGYSAFREIAHAARQHQLSTALCNRGSALEALAMAHLGICYNEEVVGWMEWPCYASSGSPGMFPFPLADEILREPPTIENGELLVPSSPGLGVDIEETVISKYPWQSGPWSVFNRFPV